MTNHDICRILIWFEVINSLSGLLPLTMGNSVYIMTWSMLFLFYHDKIF